MLEELYQSLSHDSDKIKDFIRFLYLSNKLSQQDVEEFINLYQQKLETSHTGTN